MKKLIVITLAVVLVLTLGTGLALVKGPAEKATGTVGISAVGWYADFNAHEGIDGVSGKGSMRTWYGEEGEKESRYYVKYVLVDGDEAWFAALCWDSWHKASEGKWLFVKVHDVATPGSKGDNIGWDWTSVDENDAMTRVSNEEIPDNWWGVIDGNLVVHTYE